MLVYWVSCFHSPFLPIYLMVASTPLALPTHSIGLIIKIDLYFMFWLHLHIIILQFLQVVRKRMRIANSQIRSKVRSCKLPPDVMTDASVIEIIMIFSERNRFNSSKNYLSDGVFIMCLMIFGVHIMTCESILIYLLLYSWKKYFTRKTATST